MSDDVTAYVEGVTPAVRRRDARTMVDLMRRVTGQEPRLYGSIVGFGHYHWKYASGREGDGPAASFAPRKQSLVVYLPDGVGAHEDSLVELGPHTSSVGCLYLKDLAEVDLGVLEDVVARSYATLRSGTFGHRARESGQH